MHLLLEGEGTQGVLTGGAACRSLPECDAQGCHDGIGPKTRTHGIKGGAVRLTLSPPLNAKMGTVPLPEGI
jgi:hypothetical protein